MPEKLSLLITAGNPLIAIETVDEPRARELVRDVAKGLMRPLFEWSTTRGLREVQSDGTHGRELAKAGSAVPALQHATHEKRAAVYLFLDLHPQLRDAVAVRTLRELLAACEEDRSTVILVDQVPLPDDVRRLSIGYELGWPTAEELETVVRETFDRIRGESLVKVTGRLTKREMEQLVQSLRGLSCREAERVVAGAVYDDNALDADDLPRIVEAKRTLLGSAGCLEAIAADFHVDEIGGLDNLKGWLARRRDSFSSRAREYGLESARGVLMLGVPGCGKSLCAKVVAADWHMPLLRLDPGVLYQKYIGASESQLRQALRQAEAMSPCVLWIDEIEKAFASATSSTADGGLSRRMFGTLLSWMQDHRHPIFTVATANDIASLPPELMRKGRFDEIFFVDLPDAEARRRILEIHLKRRHRDPANFDLDRLAVACEGFSGSEIEQAIVSALFAGFAERVELEDRHVLAEIEQTRPLSVIAAEKVTSLRNWARNRCVPAD